MYGIHRYVNYIFFLNIFHSITVFLEGLFIRYLRLTRDDYTVLNNCAITKKKFFF